MAHGRENQSRTYKDRGWAAHTGHVYTSFTGGEEQVLGNMFTLTRPIWTWGCDWYVGDPRENTSYLYCFMWNIVDRPLPENQVGARRGDA